MTAPSLSRRTWLALVATVLALAAVAAVAFSPGGNRAAEFGAAPESASAAAAKKATVVISIKDYEFSKKKVTIKKGQTVKWVNKDEMRHNATSSKKGGPHGPLLDKGKSYTWTATRKGTFKYHCSPHPFMKATVIVK